jgi:hypothetical protein
MIGYIVKEIIRRPGIQIAENTPFDILRADRFVGLSVNPGQIGRCHPITYSGRKGLTEGPGQRDSDACYSGQSRQAASLD